MPPLPILELRVRGEVRAAALLASDGDPLSVLLGDGRELRVPRSRVVHDTGDELPPGTPAQVKVSLVAWEAMADERAARVDLATLWDLVLAEPGQASSLT